MDNDRKIIVVDDLGNEIEMEVMFTFDADENDKNFAGNKYVFYFNPADEDPEVFVSRFDDEGNLYPIEEDATEEWDMISEVYNAFVEDEEDEVEDL